MEYSSRLHLLVLPRGQQHLFRQAVLPASSFGGSSSAETPETALLLLGSPTHLPSWSTPLSPWPAAWEQLRQAAASCPWDIRRQVQGHVLPQGGLGLPAGESSPAGSLCV